MKHSYNASYGYKSCTSGWKSRKKGMRKKCNERNTWGKEMHKEVRSKPGRVKEKKKEKAFFTFHSCVHLLHPSDSHPHTHRHRMIFAVPYDATLTFHADFFSAPF